MIPLQKYPQRLIPLALVFALAASAHASSVIVNINATPTGTGTFLYSVFITNNGPDDISILSLVGGPLSDPSIEPSFVSPSGYFAAYDSGLGIVDFLEDTATFTAGGTFGAFTFESMAAPGTAFTMFEALDINAGSISGMSNIIPEPASSGLAAIAILPLVLRRRRVA